MKAYTLILSVCTLFIYPLVNDLSILNNECAGTVGDVKHSVLPPDDFQQLNGACWILADGRNISSSTLGAMGFSHAIDPRGRFIRSKEDRNTDSRDRGRSYSDNVGSVQTALQPTDKLHIDFSWVLPQYNTLVIETNNEWSDFITTGRGRNDGREKDALRFKRVKTTEEVRPENISLFTYIRIN